MTRNNQRVLRLESHEVEASQEARMVECDCLTGSTVDVDSSASYRKLKDIVIARFNLLPAPSVVHVFILMEVQPLLENDFEIKPRHWKPRDGSETIDHLNKHDDKNESPGPRVRLDAEYKDDANDNAGMSTLLRKIYSSVHAFLIVIQFIFMGINMAKYSEEVNELTANTITILFFVHSLIKLAFFALTSKNFYRTLAIWNQSNSHPLFTESNARYHQISLTKSRRLFYFIVGMTLFSVVCWVTITFFGESVRYLVDKETNGTYTEEVPRLPIKAWYPFNAMHGTMYVVAFIFQVYWLLFTMFIANLSDLLFSSWLIFACEQLQHLKAIMRPLMELSASLDTYRPNTAELFRVSTPEKSEKMLDSVDMDIRGIYSTQQDFGMTLRGAGGRLQAFAPNNGNNPNGLSQKQEIMARSAIKYWVERHKHVVRLVTSIGDTYGTALLFHMLVSTITLTLLAYQATKINGLNVYAFSTIGYLSYTLGQVFHFCIFGNRLIEESSSVMEAAYSCPWYEGSEEAKTFVQIVCQQCQKAMSISGAKFFTVSLDLFASVLGAVVTYFMVLVQLK